MALIVQTTDGLSSANSYCDVAFADAHLAISGSFDTWDALSLDEKGALLIYSSYHADNTFDWDGEPVLDYPGLRFPRTAIYDRDGRAITGIPRLLMEGVAELGAYFADNDPFADNDLAGIQAIQIDVLSIAFSKTTMDNKIRPPAATMMKLALLAGGSGISGRRTVKLKVL